MVFITDFSIVETSSEELNHLTVVRDVLNSTRDNVNFTHEILRQAFLLPFTQAATIRRVIAVYKDWIQINVCCLWNVDL